MTTEGPGGVPRTRPGLLPWRGVWLQSRRDLAPLAVGMVVVAAAAFLSSVVPQAMDAVARSEVQAALTTRGEPVTMVVNVPITGTGYELNPDTASSAARVRDQVEAGMPAELRGVLAAPVTALVSPELEAGVIGNRPGRVRFIYVASEAGPAVQWLEGRAPESTGEPGDVDYSGATSLPVEVAISEAGAEVMGAHADTKLAVITPDRRILDVWVSGIYRATDPGDHAWAVAPTLLRPRLVDGGAAMASVGFLVTDDSVPFAQLGVFPPGMTRTYTYPVDPSAFGADDAALVATQARSLASGRVAFDIPGAQPTVRTQLDRVIDDSLAVVAAATAQASVLLIGILATAVLVELLAAGLVVERRARVLAQLRSRGATLRAIGLASAAESILLAGAAGLVGVAASALVVGGTTPWAWIVPPILAGAVLQPLLAVRLARHAVGATRPASGRHRALTAAQVRRLGLEATVALVAIGALATLIVRGATASAGSVWSDAVVLSAPVLVALAVALALVRAQPGVLRVVRGIAARRVGAVSLVAAARARAGGLATAALVTAAAIAAISASVAGTASQGLTDASWDVVGADAAATTTAPAGFPPEIAALGGADRTVATATTITGAQVIGSPVDQAVEVVAVDADAMARLLAATPWPDAPGLSALAVPGAGADGPIPVLMTGGNEWDTATLRWGEDAVAVRRLGDTPGLPPSVVGPGRSIVVDRALLASAAGHAIPGNKAWVVGAGAEAGLTAALAADPDATVITRSGWLAARASAPVTHALEWLFAGASAVATALAALAVVLMAASGSGERTRAAAQITVLGLPRAAANRVAWLEATIPAMVASAVGIAAGIGLAGQLVVALDLRTVTGGLAAPRLVVAWWTLAIPLALGLVARLAVAVAALSHRGERLGPLLRAG